MHLEMQVGPAGVADGADLSDRLPGNHRVADVHVRPSLHVAVPCDDSSGMRNVYVPTAAPGEFRTPVAVAALLAARPNVDRVTPHPFDGPGGCGDDRRVPWRSEVDSVVTRPGGGPES